MSDVDLRFTSAAEQARLIANGLVSAREVVEHSLARIDAMNPVLNAFSSVCRVEALAEADARDADVSRGGDLGPLHGVPIAIKDENDVEGVPTGYGGAAFTTPAARDSEVVLRLRQAGAIIVGKTRMPEFGIWPFTETSANGYTRNPWNPLHSPAGSSGGSAAAVASGMVAVAIGGDGGGSIRLPSSWCGLVGLKCQRGRTSAAPNANLWRSLGVIGPLTRTIEDTALVYDAIAGTTGTDQWRARDLPVPLTQVLGLQPERLRIAVSLKNPTARVRADPETAAAVQRIALALEEVGHTVIREDPAYPSLGTAFTAQVAAGVLDEAARAEHPELLERRTRGFARLARVLARGAEAAERRSVELGARFDEQFFGRFDLLLMPTTPFPAVRIGQLDGVGAVGAVRKATPVASFTSIWNVLGNPAVSLPAGLSATGLPIGVQLVGPANAEPLLLQVGVQLEKARPWASLHPAGS